MKKTFLPLLLALLAAKAAFAAPVAIGGVARNGTNKDKPLAGAVVQLVRPGADGKKTILATTRTNATGAFRFPAKDYSNTDLLMANVPYQGFDYWSVAWDGGNRLKQVGINVNPAKVDVLAFDTTTQAIPLLFQVHHLAIKTSSDGLDCVERIVVVNKTKRTLLGIGPEKVSVWLNLPKDAQDVKLDPKITDAKLVKVSSGYGIVRPITPESFGARNAIIVNYKMKWPSILPWAKKVDLSREIAYPTEFFFVARETDDKSLQVSAPMLGADEEQQLPIDGKTERRIVNSIGQPSMPSMPGMPAMPPGGDAALSPTTGVLQISVSRPVSSTFWGFAAMTLALCLFLPLALIRPKRGKDSLKSGERDGLSYVYEQHSAQVGAPITLNGIGTNIALTSHSRDLIQQIADLDDLHEAGKVSEAEYQSQRAEWKKQLIDSLASSEPS